MKLEIKNVSCGYGSKVVLSGVSMEVNSGEILSLLGPNGVGKTTLFKTILGFLKLIDGKILLDGQDVRSWSRKKLAGAIGYVPQAHTPPFPFSVIDVVLMGRVAHLGALSSPSGKDVKIADEALDSLGISYLRDRIYTEISGGERQMVLIARALTQKPDILVMDEPTSNLDFGNQIKVLKQVNRLAERGLGIVMTTHFPNHAFQCPGKVVLLQRNNRFVYGKADEVVTENHLRAAYGIDVVIKDIMLPGGNAVRSCVPLID
ncbi:ABC transporter ATP-binding protein [Paenibacillus durus]|uniref:Iron ABC transporter ATP-binding protein n=1 Tax=Paenibacillus durus ATCC 35681 TaxID=1333534 RepID=A0A0F7F934_PAEDU|nr:ABC transporter ATP-binding protein [Paenibacillus durus]AKG34377.1 iron ABC transporter ATP-binding protein [Paenibacillus durus ATCC 35681]